MNQIFIFCLLVVLLTPTVFAQNAQGPTGVTITNETDVEIRFSLQADHGRLMPFIIQSHSSKKYNCNPTCRDFYFEMNTNIKTVAYRLPNDGGEYAIQRNGSNGHWDLYGLKR